MGLWTITNVVDTDVSLPFGPNLAPQASAVFYIDDNIMFLITYTPVDPSTVAGLTKELLEELGIAQALMALATAGKISMVPILPPTLKDKGKAVGFSKPKGK